jgi:hypothetical protein
VGASGDLKIDRIYIGRSTRQVSAVPLIIASPTDDYTMAVSFLSFALGRRPTDLPNNADLRRRCVTACTLRP